MDYDTWDVKIGAFKISRFLKVDISTVRKCGQAFAILYCHQYFPSCDRTQSVFKEQKMCHESCLHLTRMCGELWEMFVKSYTIRYPEETRLLRCELQPTRNAGDSPECWYFSGDTKSTGNIAHNGSSACISQISYIHQIVHLIILQFKN